MMRFCMAGLLCNPVGLFVLLIPPQQNKRSVTHEKSAMCYSVVDARPAAEGVREIHFGRFVFLDDEDYICNDDPLTNVLCRHQYDEAMPLGQ